MEIFNEKLTKSDVPIKILIGISRILRCTHRKISASQSNVLSVERKDGGILNFKKLNGRSDNNA